jgi:hypothetical protein
MSLTNASEFCITSSRSRQSFKAPPKKPYLETFEFDNDDNEDIEDDDDTPDLITAATNICSKF